MKLKMIIKAVEKEGVNVEFWRKPKNIILTRYLLTNYGCIKDNFYLSALRNAISQMDRQVPVLW